MTGLAAVVRCVTHPDTILGSSGEIETCPDWVPSLDEYGGFVRMPLVHKRFEQFEWPPFYAAKVRNVSRLGRQFLNSRPRAI